MHRLKSIRNLIIDMDGVLYRGETPVPGIVPFFQFLRNQDIRFLLATNNSTLTQQEYSEKMARMGVSIPAEAVLTSSIAVASASGLRKASADCGRYAYASRWPLMRLPRSGTTRKKYSQ